jgi:hypothetical protein
MSDRVQTSDDELRAYLGGLGPDELVRRVVALAERDELALTALRAEAAAAAGTFDLAAFRKDLTARLRVPGYVDRRGSRPTVRAFLTDHPELIDR